MSGGEGFKLLNFNIVVIYMKSSVLDYTEHELMNCESVFDDSIPYKVYKLEGAVSGETYHSHEYMQIWYVDKGSVYHWIDGKGHHMLKGDIFVIPPYIVHKVTLGVQEDIRVIGCEFAAEFINSQFNDFKKYRDIYDFAYLHPLLGNEGNVKPKVTLSPETQIAVETVMYDMLEEYNVRNKYYDFIIKADLLRLLAIIAREYKISHRTSEEEQTIGRYRDNIVDAIEYIDENYSQKLMLEDVCRVSAMSQSYFCYIFKNLTGKTFTEYLTDLRIKKAMGLLTETDMPVSGICFDVGFNNVAYFCRIFKKDVGTSPGEYRRIIRQA